MTNLVELFSVQTNSENEKMMTVYIARQLDEMNVSYYIDHVGNIIASKGFGQMPCYVCHIDTVHSLKKDFRVVTKNRTLYGVSNGRQVGVGGDDKCGIYVCLKMLETLDNVLCVFFTQEETGCIGSFGIDIGTFNDALFVLQFDRKGSSDFIRNAASVELCSDAFGGNIPERYGYRTAFGLMTDVMALKNSGLSVSCANVSCGYYNPHTDIETVNIDDLDNALSLALSFAKEVTTVQEHDYAESQKSLYDYEYEYMDDNSKPISNTEYLSLLEFADTDKFLDLYNDPFTRSLAESIERVLKLYKWSIRPNQYDVDLALETLNQYK